MLAIRLQRVGRKKKPLYRVVVSEKTKDMYGDHLEILGQYNPHSKEAVLKEDRIKHWISVGAQASDTVGNLLIKEGVLEGDKKKAVSISKKRAIKQAKDLEHSQKDVKKVESKPKATDTKEETTPEVLVEEVKVEITGKSTEDSKEESEIK